MSKEVKQQMCELTPSELGQQLFKPIGDKGKLVGENMNISNNYIYSMTCQLVDFRDNDKVLEIGFGNGKFFSKYFDKNPNIQIYGIDFSDVMCSEATLINQTYIDKNLLQIKCEDSLKTRFENNFFDTIISINTIYFWDSIDEQIEEISRILKYNGKLLLGIRPKSIMEKLPFTKEVFKLFDSIEVIELFEKHNFRFVDEKIENISRKSADGKEVDSIDICILLEKYRK